MADEMKKVEEFLKGHPSLKITTGKEGKCRVVCKLTSHEMPCILKAVETHVNGKKYKYECKNRLTVKEQQLSCQYLILKKRGQLYCTLTKRHLNNLPHHVKLHLKGRRFQKAIGNNDKSSTFSEQKILKNEEHPTQCDKDDAQMWVPSNSDSESAENETLGSDFELDRECKAEEKEGNTSDILDMQPSVETKKPISKSNSTDHKRTNSNKNVKKAKKMPGAGENVLKQVNQTEKRKKSDQNRVEDVLKQKKRKNK